MANDGRAKQITGRMHAFCRDALGSDDATGVALRISTGEISAGEAVAASIERADRMTTLAGFAATDFDRALALTRTAHAGAFAGVPTAIKDNCDVAGLPTRDGSRAVGFAPARRDAPVVSQILSSGVIPLGKSTMPEFGFNATTEFETSAPARNPWNTAFSTGGSSGGSAALVAAGVVPIAHANDGGGSIRIPAAARGLVGLKFTRGRELADDSARYMPLNVLSNGILTRTVRDTARFAHHIEQHGPLRGLPPIGLIEGPSTRRVRIGVVDEALPGHSFDEDTQRAIGKTAERLANLGHDVVSVGLPIREQDLTALEEDFIHYWGMLAFGVRRFGGMIVDAQFDSNELDAFTKGLASRFERRLVRTPGVIWRLKSIERKYRLAYYGGISALLSPVVSHTTPELGYLSPAGPFSETVSRLRGWLALTPLENVAGGPAISLPVEVTSTGLPLGLQLSANLGGEATLLELAYELEADRPFRNIDSAHHNG
ncbi:amidase [Williamsia maris]|uniref:amidase n=2 Tax=Williamsia maris TaxID=72806 RepID=A0ABT1HJI1_9NOCA|nr:amidase [Williamsia maris]